MNIKQTTFNIIVDRINKALARPYFDELQSNHKKLEEHLSTAIANNDINHLKFVACKTKEFYSESNRIIKNYLDERDEDVMLRRQSFIHSNTKNEYFKDTRWMAMKNDAALFEMDNLSIDELKTLFA